MNARIMKWSGSCVLALGLLGTGCGGGGGGSDGTVPTAAPETPASTQAPQTLPVAISWPREQQALNIQGYDGKPVTVALAVDATGDFSLLNGKTLYVVVEMPHKLFRPEVGISMASAAPAATIGLTGDPQAWAAPGHYAGTMKVHVCLDPACTSTLQNSPLLMPYDITIGTAMSLSPAALDLSVPFGTPREGKDVLVTLPQGAQDWEFLDLQTGGLFQKVGDRIRVTPPDYAPPGNYKASVLVIATAQETRGGNTRWVNYIRDLSVDLSVRPSAVPFVLIQPSSTYEARFNSRDLVHVNVTALVGDPAASLRVSGIRWDSMPPAAAGHAQRERWLWANAEGYSYELSACGIDGVPPACLPAGVYGATILYRYLGPAGTATEVGLPVTMTIAP